MVCFVFGLNIPPFKGARAQLSAEEVTETVHITSVRIHVEQAIGRIKNYHILDGTLPLTLAHTVDQIFSVCAYLTNFLPPLLRPVKSTLKKRLGYESMTMYFFTAPFDNMQTVNKQPHFSLSLIILVVISANRSSLPQAQKAMPGFCDW